MTIHVTIKNDDSRANAVIQVLTEDEYTPTPGVTTKVTTTQATLRGGEEHQLYLTSTRNIKVIEIQNG